MGVHVDVHMSKMMHTSIKVGAPTYTTYTNC